MNQSEAAQVLSTLSLRQAQAVETLLPRLQERNVLRDALLTAYRSVLPPGSPTRHAARLAAELRTADPRHPHAPLLALVALLSRRGIAPGSKTIERALLKADAA